MTISQFFLINLLTLPKNPLPKKTNSTFNSETQTFQSFLFQKFYQQFVFKNYNC